MKKLYLVENYTTEVKFDKNSLVIGLTPLACYQLGKASVDYKIWEDYVNVSKFTDQYSEYHYKQKLWLEDLDRFLVETIPPIKSIQLPLATTYHFYLGSIIDSLVLRARELNLFFRKFNPSQVVYVSRLPQKDIINFTLLFRGDIEGLFSRLTPLLCQKHGIPFERIHISPDIKKQTERGLSIKKVLSLWNIKEFFSNRKYIKIFWNDLNIFNICLKIKKIKHIEKFARTAIFFLEQNSYLRKIMAQAIKNGYQVYYKSDNSIIRQYPNFHLIKYHLDNEKKNEPTYNLEAIIQKLKKNTSLLNWLNQACEVNVESIILPRLSYFIQILSPKIIFLTSEYAKMYDNLDIKFAFLTGGAAPADCAAVAACKYSKKTKIGLIGHGDGAFDFREFLDDYVSPYDMFFASNDELAGYLQERRANEKFNTNILQSPIRYAILPIKKSLKPEMGKNKPKVVFVPTMYPWDNNFWVFLRPDTWYFHWHKKLLEFFASRTDFEFIWKALPASNEIYDPIVDIIKEKKYPNVHYATDPFVNWISIADRVLSDYPSTALYESAFSGLPVMSLYFAPFCRVRKTATKMFGKSLQPFSNFSEGVQKISAFLDANASQFIANIPHSNQPFINLLNSINYSKRGNK